MGRTLFLKYHIMHLSWNAYLRLIDIDYQKYFSCPTCATNPETIILDGVTLGTIREIPNDDQPKETAVTTHIPIEKRIWISNPKLRRTLKRYIKDGLSPKEFTIMVADLDPGAFQEYITNSYATCANVSIVLYRPNNKNISSILKYLSSVEPISGIFQFSILNEEELGFVVDLSDGTPATDKQIDLLYRKMINFKPLFEPYQLEVLPSQPLRLHPLVSGLLHKIIDKVEYLFTRPSMRQVSVDFDLLDYLNYFPAFEQQYRYHIW